MSVLTGAMLLAGQTAQPAPGQQGQEQPGRGRGGVPAAAGRVNGPDGALWGLDNTPVIPGLPWRIHDANRPQPPVVKPPARPGGPPSDAIVLFDGTDLSRWGVRNQVAGPTALLTVHQYTPHDAELPLSIQGRAPVRFRNIWIRRIKGYDRPEGSL